MFHGGFRTPEQKAQAGATQNENDTKGNLSRLGGGSISHGNTPEGSDDAFYQILLQRRVKSWSIHQVNGA